MNINVSCEKCGYSLEVVRKWSERGNIEITVMPCRGDCTVAPDDALPACDCGMGDASMLLAHARCCAISQYLSEAADKKGPEVIE